MAELTVSIVAHALLGLGLAAAVWTLGRGAVPQLAAAFAYPLGLLVATVAALLVLISSWLAPLSVVVLAVAVVRALRAPLAWGPFVRAAPAGVGLGTALGLLNHGPTSSVDSSAYGDMLFYAAKTVSASQSLFPFRDLLVEGERHVWVETAWVLLGGALTWLPGFDVILFQAAAAPAFLVGALALGLGTLARRDVSRFTLLALLGVACIAYPSWVSESPPVALAVPLTFALFALWRVPLRPFAFAAVCAAVAACFFLTKGFGLIPLAVVAVVALVRDHRRAALPVLAAGALVAAAGIAVVAVTSAWLFDVLGLKFLPGDAVQGLADQLDRRSTQDVAPAFLVAGELALTFVLARIRAWTPLALLVAALAGSWIVGGHGFDIAVGIAVLFAVLELRDRDAPVVPLAAAGGLLAASAWLRDIVGIRAAAVLVALLFAALFAALAPAVRVRWAVPALAAAVLALAFGLGSRQTTLTTGDHDVWERVRERVPSDGLVFTSETGPRITGDEGWNYYPGVAGRQIFVAGWSSSTLLVDDERRAERLRENADVLAGRLEPTEAAPGYESYYAVVRRGEALSLEPLP